MEFILIFLAVFFGSQYILGPILAYFNLRREPATMNLKVFDPRQEQPPGYAREFFGQVYQGLEKSGFKITAFVRSEMSGNELILMLFHNRKQMDAAMACSLKSSELHNTYLEYCTEFENGFEICTNNSMVPLGTFAPKPGKNVYQYPTIENIDLYRVHQEILKKYGPSSPKILPPDEKAVQYLVDGLRKDNEYQVTAGYKNYDARSDTFSATIKGAVLMTWKLCFPIKQIRSQIRKSQFHKILRHLKLNHYK